MNWFQHDTDSTQDAKIKKLLIHHGAIGYAVYFHCLELIASDISESNLTFELEHDSEIIAANLFIKGTSDKSGIDIVEEIMRDIIEIGLFSQCDGHVFCFKLLKRMSLSMTSNPTFRTAINKKKEEYHDDIMTHHDLVKIGHETLHYTTLPTLKKEKSKSKENNSFSTPILEDVVNYCEERGNRVDAIKFFDFYESKGWMVGKNKMKDWKASVRTWERSDKEKAKQANTQMRF